MQVNPENIAKLQDYYRALVARESTPIRETEAIAIVHTLDMLGLDVLGVNYPD